MPMTSTQAADILLSCIYDIIDFELTSAVDPIWPDAAATFAKPEFRHPDPVGVSSQRVKLVNIFDVHLAAYRRAVIDAGEQDAITLREWSRQLSFDVSQLQHWEDSFTHEQSHDEFVQDIGQFLQNVKLSACWGNRQVMVRAFLLQTTLTGLVTELSREHYLLRLEDEVSKLVEKHLREGISIEELREKVLTEMTASKINLGAAFRKEVPRLIGRGIIEDSAQERTIGPDGAIIQARNIKGGARPKIISGLTEHHQYDSVSCLNFDPIVIQKFAKKFGVGVSTVSDFLGKECGIDNREGYEKYSIACRNKKIATYLAKWRDEIPTRLIVESVENSGKHAHRSKSNDE